jgi:hypothetical protein
MGVFGKSTKVSRAVADPGTDDTLPSSGALSWGGITGVAAVAGTTGADAKLVKGDRWEQINGSLTHNCTANVKTTIFQNHTHIVMANQTLQTLGNVNKTNMGNITQTVLGSHLLTQCGPQTRTHLSPVSDFHSDRFTVHNSIFGEYAPERGQNIGRSYSLVGIEFQLRPVISTAIRNVRYEISNLKNVAGLFDSKLALFSCKNAGLENRIKGIKSTIFGIDPKTGGPQMNAVAGIFGTIFLGGNQVF